jgi:hypothetical protein
VRPRHFHLLRYGNTQICIDLHSLWDGLLIAKALRSVPKQYDQPLPAPQIEHALRGTIYDSYVRMIMWEGVLGASRWGPQIPDWLACPVPLAYQSACVADADAFNAPQASVSGTDDGVVCPHHWATVIHALNCEVVWPAALDAPPYNDTRPPAGLSGHQQLFALDADADADPALFLELDTPEYAGVISERWIVEKLLAQAGLRLAGVLNYLFADFGVDEDEQRLRVHF